MRVLATLFFLICYDAADSCELSPSDTGLITVESLLGDHRHSVPSKHAAPPGAVRGAPRLRGIPPSWSTDSLGAAHSWQIPAGLRGTPEAPADSLALIVDALPARFDCTYLSTGIASRAYDWMYVQGRASSLPSYQERAGRSRCTVLARIPPAREPQSVSTSRPLRMSR